MPTSRHLDLQLAHARARDAVWRPFGAVGLADAFRADGHEVIAVHSAARDRGEYLARPDLGRRLAPESAALLATRAGAYDLGFVVGDGLAPLAAEGHAPALVRALLARIDPSWRVAPVVVAEQMGDEAAAVLGARMVVVLIGERPGMSAQDSLGAYVTWAPRLGRSDAERNCVSNVRPEGLSYEAAAATIAWLLKEARRRELTGVALRVEPVTEIAGKQVVGGE